MAAPRLQLFRSVVAGEHDDRVVGNAELLKRIEHGAEIGIKLQEAVGPFALSGLPLELRPRQDREMHQRMVEVEKERLSGSHAPLHEVPAAPQEFGVDVPPDLLGQLPNRPDFSSLLAFKDTGDA